MSIIYIYILPPARFNCRTVHFAKHPFSFFRQTTHFSRRLSRTDSPPFPAAPPPTTSFSPAPPLPRRPPSFLLFFPPSLLRLPPTRIQGGGRSKRKGIHFFPKACDFAGSSGGARGLEEELVRPLPLLQPTLTCSAPTPAAHRASSRTTACKTSSSKKSVPPLEFGTFDTGSNDECDGLELDDVLGD